MKGMYKMDNRPIGMFDSGVGGMTVFKEIIKYNKNEDIVYLGDTKRFPYGSKSKETIIDLTRRGIEFLIKNNVKAIVIACGTATSQALEILREEYDIPIIGIIEPTVNYIKENERLKNIGVIATTGTIRSRGWQDAIVKANSNLSISYKACPLLAPMAEEGWTDNEIARLTIKEYLKDFKNIDCLILGCTHYPLFKNAIQEVLDSEVEIINTGEMVCRKLKEMLDKNDMKSEVKDKANYEIYLTDKETNFLNVAYNLLEDNELVDEIIQVEI